MEAASRPDWAGRLARVARDCGSRNLDALVVTHPVNIKYLSGFGGTTAILVVSPKHTARLLTDGRYLQAVRDALRLGEMGPVELVPVEGRYESCLVAALATMDAGRVGFEAVHVTVAVMQAWIALAPAVDWQSTEALVEKHRAIKETAEIRVLRRGARALSAVAGRLREWVAPGRTEIAVARDIDRALEEAGFSGPAFPTIVATGPNSALPHARPTSRAIAAGDLVLLDFGGVLDGYCVDLTRMAAVSPVAADLAALFEAVREAQVSALNAVRPGVAGSSVDRAARDVLEARGYGAAFVHGTGHGLGLEVHEAPRLGREPREPRTPGSPRESPEILETGMVCTIEPGAYLEGRGGVRLEDDVLVTPGGCEVLTTAPRDLVVV
jgi:Xaa-Pro aminopeptidase